MTHPEPFMHPFPEPEIVFAGDVELHRKHFLPLISIDASAIDPSWKGLLHVVSVKETYDGAVGEHCSEFHTDLCKYNQVAFRVGPDGRYTFLADFRYFIVERGHKAGTSDYSTSQEFADEFAEHYDRMEKSFQETKSHFQKTGVLNPNHDRQPERTCTWLRLGSEASLVNARAPGEIGGRAFRFVAQTTGYSYCESGADTVALFYDPIDGIAVVVFDFT